MNENIQELYEEASLTEGPNGVRYSLPNELVEKLVTSTAQKCIDICEAGNATQTTSGGAATLIKQFFGIK
jgi:uncharacterized phage protein gp47/JayE